LHAEKTSERAKSKVKALFMPAVPIGSAGLVVLTPAIMALFQFALRAAIGPLFDAEFSSV
jgi:hypothetical protein